MVWPALFGSVITASSGTSTQIAASEFAALHDTIVTAPRFPVGILHDVTVGERAAEALAARQMLKPVVQRRVDLLK
jgi:hypothetical protein